MEELDLIAQIVSVPFECRWKAFVFFLPVNGKLLAWMAPHMQHLT